MDIRQSTDNQEVLIGPFIDETDGITPLTGLSIANTDIKLFKSGATSEVNKNDSSGGTHLNAARFCIVLNSTDSNTAGTMDISAHISGALPVHREVNVLTQAEYDAKYSTGPRAANVTHYGGSAGTFSSGRPEIIIVDGGITTNKIATGAIDADALATDAVAEIISGILGMSILGTPASDTFLQWIQNTTTAIGSRASQTSVDTLAGYVDTEIASIVSSLSTIDGKIDTIDDLLDTEIAAIVSALSTIEGKIDTVDNLLDTEIAAIITSLSTIAGYIDTEIVAIITTLGTISTSLGTLSTDLGNVPTVSEFEARTILAANYVTAAGAQTAAEAALLAYKAIRYDATYDWTTDEGTKEITINDA